jgi:hypothetical protein
MAPDSSASNSEQNEMRDIAALAEHEHSLLAIVDYVTNAAA